jgi:hypothetical protein
MIQVEVHEEIEDKFCHFYSGLRAEIVDYKEYSIINHLFQLAMLAEIEL